MIEKKVDRSTQAQWTAMVEKAYCDLYVRLDTKEGDWLDIETKLF